jgi:hypothetical protein
MDYNRTDGKGSRVAVAISKFSRVYQIPRLQAFQNRPYAEAEITICGRSRPNETGMNAQRTTATRMVWSGAKLLPKFQSGFSFTLTPTTGAKRLQLMFE